MDLVRLVYHSRIRRTDLGESLDDRVADILSMSMLCNQRDDITGVLVHDVKHFVQVLEGPDRLVSQTFERILRDPRHGDVTLVSMQPIPARRFGSWWMAHVAWTDANAGTFRYFGESDPFDPQVMRPERMLDLIEALVARPADRTRLEDWKLPVA